MGLNLSNEQIAEELELDRSDVQEMTTQLREGYNVPQNLDHEVTNFAGPVRSER